MKNILTQKETNHIDQVCQRYNINNYTINPDGSIDVDDDVKLSNRGLDKLPIKFGKVSGNFHCGSNKLTSLEGCPKSVDANFNCCDNKLTSLEFSPSSINGYFDCSENKLISLEFSPISVDGNFNCSYNQLTSLEFSPIKVTRNFACHDNKLTSLEGCPESVGGIFNCSENKLTSLKGCPSSVGGQFFCSYNKLLPARFVDLYNKIISEEFKIFVKYQHDLRIWEGEYKEEAAQDLFDDIKDGML